MSSSFVPGQLLAGSCWQLQMAVNGGMKSPGLPGWPLSGLPSRIQLRSAHSPLLPA